MKTNKKIKNLLCYVVAFMLAVAANFAFTKFEKQPSNVFAGGNQNSEPISLDNPTFNNNTSSTYPFAPKYYEASSNNSSAEAGVINVEESKYSSKFTNLSRGSLYDNYVLMIDAGENNVNHGYTTTESISLTKGNNYLISVDVYTANGGTAYLSLINGNDEFDSISNIISTNDWTTYYFLVKTNDYEDVSVKLGMFLKSSGTAMFDNICAAKINNQELATYLGEPSSVVSYTNKATNIIKEYNIQNVTFNHVDFEYNSTISPSYCYNPDGNQTYAYKISSAEKAYFEVETTKLSDSDETIEFEQNAVYKVSVNLKAEDLKGNVTLKLNQIVEDEETANNASFTISSNTSSTIKNNYSTYSFYIKSSPIKNSEYKLAVALGSKSEKASGSIYVSSIVVSKVTDSAFDAISEDTTNKKINLSSSYKITSSATALDNGKFNTLKISDVENSYPAAAESWTVTTGENKQAYGIVNTSSTEFAKISGLNNLSNPLGTNGTATNNNVLMLHNSESDILSYTSTTKNLAAKSIHRFQALVQTQHSPATISLVTNKDGKEVVLSSLAVDTDYSWETVELFVKVGYQALDVALKVTLDSSSWAYTYIDDARFDYPSQPTESTFNDINSSRLVSKVDLTKLIVGDENSCFSHTNQFTGTGSSAIFGVVNVNNGTVENTEFLATNADYVLAIRSTTETTYNVKANLGFTLESGDDKYYKISVDILTQYLQMLDPEADTDLMGASVKLSSFEESFTAIQAGEWTTYTFYISPSETTTAYLEFNFGTEENKMMGDVFIGNIVFNDSVSEREFNAVSESETTKILKQTIVEKEPNETEKTDKDEEKTNVNWFYFASSMIFAVALIIGVVGIMIKKIKWKKPVKKTKNAYDRNRTVSKQYYMRKATTEREAKLRELEKDLQKLHDDRVKYEDEYKQDLAKLRQLKIKRASADEIRKLEKDMKKNQKLSASIGITINKIKSEISYVKTDAYLNSLTKKLASQPSNTEETENN